MYQRSESKSGSCITLSPKIGENYGVDGKVLAVCQSSLLVPLTDCFQEMNQFQIVKSNFKSTRAFPRAVFPAGRSQ